jgi:hypothetical protein
VTSAPLRIFIGFDSREPVAYHVAAHSILRRASIPVSIAPLAITQLRGLYTRQRGPTESTEFSLTRFLVPYLCDFKGIAIFMDCDMVLKVDIADVMIDTPQLQERAVYVCQHDYEPKPGTKFLEQMQTAYPRKNWSSFAVFNCDHCRLLTPDYVNAATGLQLHRFQWTTDQQIGSLPLEWNWLVGEYPQNPDAKVLHYTLGGPWFLEFAECDQADVWWDEYAAMRAPLITAAVECAR